MTEFHRPPCVKANGKPKVAYRSKGAALRAVRDTRRGNLKDARPVHAYHCPDCGRWHVGHFDKPDEGAA